MKIDHWREQFKTLSYLKSGFTLAHMGAAEDNKVIAVFETNNPDEFLRIFNDPSTAEAMANDKITGGVELFILDEFMNHKFLICNIFLVPILVINLYSKEKIILLYADFKKSNYSIEEFYNKCDQVVFKDSYS